MYHSIDCSENWSGMRNIVRILLLFIIFAVHCDIYTSQVSLTQASLTMERSQFSDDELCALQWYNQHQNDVIAAFRNTFSYDCKKLAKRDILCSPEKRAEHAAEYAVAFFGKYAPQLGIEWNCDESALRSALTKVEIALAQIKYSKSAQGKTR